MGLFKKSFVKRIEDISERVEQISLTEDDLILKFSSKVQMIEERDIECIRLLKKIAKQGHISEKQKRALLRQLVFLLRRLEQIKFEGKSEVASIKSAIEDVLQFELTAERIGIELNKQIYHGTGIEGIRTFESNREEFDYSGIATLGIGINCTDNKKMSVNYAFYRYNKYKSDEQLMEKYSKRIQPTVYTFRLKKGRNYIADLTDPIKLRFIYKDLLEYLKKRKDEGAGVTPYELTDFIRYLWMIIRKKIIFKNLSHMLAGRNLPESITSINNLAYYICEFLMGMGYHGLRSLEGGEPLGSIFPWERSMTYLIFDPNDIEIIKEEHFKLKDGKLIIMH